MNFGKMNFPIPNVDIGFEEFQILKIEHLQNQKTYGMYA